MPVVRQYVLGHVVPAGVPGWPGGYMVHVVYMGACHGGYMVHVVHGCISESCSEQSFGGAVLGPG